MRETWFERGSLTGKPIAIDGDSTTLSSLGGDPREVSLPE